MVLGIVEVLGLCQASRTSFRTEEHFCSIYISFLYPKLPASLSLRLCSLTRSCHGLELWNTSLQEVSAWRKTAEGLDGPSLERHLFPTLDTDAMGRS